MPNEKNFSNKMFQTKLRERSLSFLLFTNRRSFTTILKSIEVGIRHTKLYLTLSWRRYLSYRNQSTDFQNKSMDWFLYMIGTTIMKELITDTITYVHFLSIHLVKFLSLLTKEILLVDINRCYSQNV